MIYRALSPFVLLSFVLLYAAGVATYGARIAGHALGASGSLVAIIALMVASATHAHPAALIGGLACVAGAALARRAAYRAFDVKGHARAQMRERAPSLPSPILKISGLIR
jgi:hypothetical protein